MTGTSIRVKDLTRRRTGRTWSVFFLSFLLSVTAPAQSDSTLVPLKLKHTIAPVTLTLAGFAVQGKISRQLQNQVVKRYPGFHTNAEDFLWAAPSALAFGLSASGVKGKHSLKEQVLLFVISSALSAGAAQTLKWISRYPRPDLDGNDAFPSGHTALAFTNAGFLHEEYGHRSIWYSVGGFGNAAAVGGLRMLNNRHWLADVLVGAGIGVGASKAVYLAYPYVKRKVQKKRQ